MRELERAVRVAEERQEVVRRRVGEEVEVRRRRLVGVLEGLEAAAEPTTRAETTQTPTTEQGTLGNPFLGRTSRFGLGGWVDRAGEAVGIRSSAGAVPVVAGETEPGAGTGTGESTPRAPSQAEIDSVVAMFPNLSRDTVVRALQRR